jgi:SnoaL-like domain
MIAEDVMVEGIGKDIMAEWVWNYFRDVDSFDPNNVTKHYTENGQFRFANQEPVRGKEAIAQLLAEFYQNLQAMSHRNVGLWLGNNSAVFEAEVTFTRKDGSQLTLPAASIIRRSGELVYDFRMIMDVSPVLNSH